MLFDGGGCRVGNDNGAQSAIAANGFVEQVQGFGGAEAIGREFAACERFADFAQERILVARYEFSG